MTDAIEIVPNRLYWASVREIPKDTAKSHYFSVDEELLYEPFFCDFGPLNLGMICRYCKVLEGKLAEPSLVGKRIVHCCSQEPEKRANAAVLVCAYQVIVLGRPALAVHGPFQVLDPPLKPFRDASSGACSFHMTLGDCLEALHFSIEKRWFDWTRFNIDSYDYFSQVDNGDMNWIIPGKFLAFAGPSPTPIDADGFPAFTPEDYVPVFMQAGIGLAVRLNKPCYDRRRFVDHGIRHVDLYFRDGSCPSRSIISKFLHVTESESGAVAVHCKAGLGRTGTLIGLYAMKNYFFPARAFIAWNRMCRPGSILGPQQQFLVAMEREMFQAGMATRGPPRLPQLMPDHIDALAQQTGQLTLQDGSRAEQYEDVGQGERLCNAKRGKQGSELMAAAEVPQCGRLQAHLERPMAR
mmetsp:Transcript_28544/g.90989  ORF Transcript_28544/g.90989 Transcript_28544/m.90989 type:complete len:409 (+) Transcript_28544:236-1462(+)